MGVSIIEDTGSRWAAVCIADISVLPTVVGCNNKQRAANFWAKRPDDEKNNETFVPVVSDNVAGLSWLPPPNRFPFCLRAFRRVHHNTSYHRLERHRCSIVGLAEPAPNRLAGWLCFFRLPHPNWEDNVWHDLQRSERRFCFFLLQISVQLVQFRHFGLVWHRHRR